MFRNSVIILNFILSTIFYCESTSEQTVSAGKAVCRCEGDPHCYSFDADKSDRLSEIFVTKSCMYTLARDDCRGQWPSFEVIANFQRAKPTLERTYVHDLRVHYQGRIYFLEQGRVFRDYRLTPPLPYTTEKVTVAEEGNVLVVTLSNGVTIKWDGMKMVQIEVAKEGVFAGEVCGLCGNNDGQMGNDMAQGPHMAGRGARPAGGPSNSKPPNNGPDGLPMTGFGPFTEPMSSGQPGWPSGGPPGRTKRARLNEHQNCPAQLVTEGQRNAQAGREEAFINSWFREKDLGDTSCEAECQMQ